MRSALRPVKAVNREDFSNDIQSLLEPLASVHDLDSLTNGYNDALRSTLDDHAPIVEKDIILRPHAPWYTESLRKAKRERRQCERRWLRSGLTVDKESYQQHCKIYNSLLYKSKTEYHSNQIAESSDRNLFRIVDKLSTPASDN